MTTGFIIKLIIIAAVLIIAVAVIGIVIRAVRRTVNRTVNRAETQVIKGIIDTATSQNFQFDGAQSGPKKISNMNKIYLPLIEKDFPGFNWTEARQMIEQEIKAHYAKRKHFTLYETAVSRYEKSGSNVTLVTESAASDEENGSKRYTIVQTTLGYIRTCAAEGNAQGEHALNCPNCSAPLKRNAAGELICEYCGTLVSGEKTWQITDIREA